MAFGELFSWLRDFIKYFLTEAPYPLKIAFWVFLFLGLSGIVSLMFSFNTLCDSTGQAYSPDNYWTSFKLNIEKLGLDSGVNVSAVNTSLDDMAVPSIWAEAWLFWGSQNYVDDFKVTYSDYIDYGRYIEYDDDLKSSATLQEVDDNQLLYVDCVGINSRFYVGGVDIASKELWITLLVVMWVAPILIFVLKKK